MRRWAVRIAIERYGEDNLNALGVLVWEEDYEPPVEVNMARHISTLPHAFFFALSTKCGMAGEDHIVLQNDRTRAHRGSFYWVFRKMLLHLLEEGRIIQFRDCAMERSREARGAVEYQTNKQIKRHHFSPPLFFGVLCVFYSGSSATALAVSAQWFSDCMPVHTQLMACQYAAR